MELAISSGGANDIDDELQVRKDYSQRPVLRIGTYLQRRVADQPV